MTDVVIIHAHKILIGHKMIGQNLKLGQAILKVVTNKMLKDTFVFIFRQFKVKRKPLVNSCDVPAYNISSVI